MPRRPTPSVRRVTVRDVAQHAGVSQPTVSLVLGRNPHARIAPETRERVLRAAEELGYRVNLVARGLSRRRSYAIGLAVPDLRNPFFVDVIAGAERVVAEEGYALLLCETGADAAKQLDMLQARQIDGVIMDAASSPALAGGLQGLNVVLIDESSGRWPAVTSDAEGAGRLAAEHLLGLGHRALAFAGPAGDVHALRRRERGFTRSLREAGVGLGSAQLRRAPATTAGGLQAMQALLALPTQPRPTAVFCANDLMAIGALKACARAGVRVPEDVSIVGCDDIELARLVTPELTTVSVPARALGARAARLLLRRLGGDARAELPTRALPVQLVPRGTTAPPAHVTSSTTAV